MALRFLVQESVNQGTGGKDDEINRFIERATEFSYALLVGTTSCANCLQKRF